MTCAGRSPAARRGPDTTEQADDHESATMRAVIFGAGGMLGQALAAGLPGAGYQVVGAPAGRKDGDIADAELVAATLDGLKPEVVFNAAAWTDVDGAEDHPDEARRANAEGP